MSTRKPGYNIYVTVPDGNPSGLRILTKSSWTGKLFFFPRSNLHEVLTQYPELNGVGVYLLVVLYENPPTIYIGEADGLKDRLIQHNQNPPRGIDFSHIIVFTEGCKDSGASFVHKAIAQYLESRLIQLAKEAKKAVVINVNNPTLPTLSQREEIEARNILDEIMLVLPLTGLDLFRIEAAGQEMDSVVFIMEKERKAEKVLIQARMQLVGSKYVVLKGSQAFATETDSCPKSYRDKRSQLKEARVLVQDPRDPRRLLFDQDYDFDSPSQAAGVVYGGAINGRTEWKMINDRQITLAEFEEGKVAAKSSEVGGIDNGS